LVETSKQLSLASTTLSLKQQERRRTELTLKELDPITDDVKTFKGVGRMYFSFFSFLFYFLFF